MHRGQKKFDIFSDKDRKYHSSSLQKAILVSVSILLPMMQGDFMFVRCSLIT